MPPKCTSHTPVQRSVRQEAADIGDEDREMVMNEPSDTCEETNDSTNTEQPTEHLTENLQPITYTAEQLDLLTQEQLDAAKQMV